MITVSMQMPIYYKLKLYLIRILFVEIIWLVVMGCSYEAVSALSGA
jgi:hypothetical protein